MSDRPTCPQCDKPANEPGCCLLCPILRPNRRGRHSESNACEDCRTLLAAIPREIADADALLDQLLEPGRGPATEVRPPSPDPRLPFAIDVWDLSQPLRTITINKASVEDQIGHLPVAVQLDSWVRDWIDLRELDENGPRPNVRDLANWLAVRTEWACDEHPAIDEYAQEMRSLRSVLVGLVGVVKEDAKPVPIRGVPCRRCDRMTLAKLSDGSGEVECQDPSCRTIYRPDEYERWVKLVAAATRQPTRAAVVAEHA